MDKTIELIMVIVAAVVVTGILLFIFRGQSSELMGFLDSTNDTRCENLKNYGGENARQEAREIGCDWVKDAGGGTNGADGSTGASGSPIGGNCPGKCTPRRYCSDVLSSGSCDSPQLVCCKKR